MKGTFLSFILFFVVVFSAFAGFEGLNNGTSLKIFNKINCSTGVNCTRGANGTFTLDTDGALENQVSVTASPTTITSSQCGSTFINGTDPVQVNLPEASTVNGCRMTFVTSTATTFLVNPDDADKILLWTDAAGDAISNAVSGNTITLQAIDDTNWVTVSGTGSYTDAN